MAGSESPPSRRTGGLGALAALVLIVAGMRAAATILVPVVFALFLAVLLAPAVRALRRCRVPAILAIPMVVLAAVAVVILFGGILGQTVNSMVEEAPTYQQRASQLVRGLAEQLGPLGRPLHPDRLKKFVEPGDLLPIVGTMVTGFATVVSYTLLVVVMVVFFLFDALDMPDRLDLAFRGSDVDIQRLKRVAEEVKKYIVLKSYMCLLAGATTWAILFLMGVDFAPLWALLAVIFGYVPTLGALVSTVPPVMLSLLQMGPGRSGILLVLLVGLNILIGNFLEPLVFGRRLGLSTLAVFLSLVAWGWLWGPAGMLLSVPLTMVTKILLENSERWQWLGVLLEPSSGERTRRLSMAPVSSRRGSGGKHSDE